jgi:membrane-associated phospholipid phosphatase
VCTALAVASFFPGARSAVAQTLTPTIPQVPEAPRAYAGLFRDTATDFGHLASKKALTTLAIGGLIAAAAHGMDRKATDSVSTMDAGFFGAGETIGSARAQFGSALATFLVGQATGNARLTAVGADLVSANLVAQTMTLGIKTAVRRGRPDGTEYSFPSGHTSTTFAAATVLQRHFGWKAGAPAYALASYVATSRIHDKRHFLSDVTFGAAVGIVSGWAVTVGHGKAEFSVAPIATRGGGGVGFTWIGQ